MREKPYLCCFHDFEINTSYLIHVFIIIIYKRNSLCLFCEFDFCEGNKSYFCNYIHTKENQYWYYLGYYEKYDLFLLGLCLIFLYNFTKEIMPISHCSLSYIDFIHIILNYSLLSVLQLHTPINVCYIFALTLFAFKDLYSLPGGLGTAELLYFSSNKLLFVNLIHFKFCTPIK